MQWGVFIFAQSIRQSHSCFLAKENYHENDHPRPTVRHRSERLRRACRTNADSHSYPADVDSHPAYANPHPADGHYSAADGYCWADGYACPAEGNATRFSHKRRHFGRNLAAPLDKP